MKATLANVWHPIRGIAITYISVGRFLFRLFHRVDADHIEARGPWHFNSHHLILHRLQSGENSKEVPLH